MIIIHERYNNRSEHPPNRHYYSVLKWQTPIPGYTTLNQMRTSNLSRIASRITNLSKYKVEYDGVGGRQNRILRIGIVTMKIPKAADIPIKEVLYVPDAKNDPFNS